MNHSLTLKKLTPATAEFFPTSLQALLVTLHQEFAAERRELLGSRQKRQAAFDAGQVPSFSPEHPARTSVWAVAPIPTDLLDRRIEITGPVSSAKMVINMLSANAEGAIANTAMLDFEDSMAPTWDNVLGGLANIIAVSHKTLSYTQAAENGKAEKQYRLDPQNMALPMVRVRGLHMEEPHVLVNGEAVSAGLFDLACTAFHTAKTFLADKKTPKFYIPKCEHYLEARWWNRVLQKIEAGLGLPQAALRVTFLIETLPAAFQMEEILYEIRERACGLNGGRWDKIFSDIKTLKMHPDRIMANRSSIDMTKPWMDNYAKLLIQTCHKHGAFAMGGMSAFTPGSDAATRDAQVEKVRLDKSREAQIGHDGCWVSHPFFISMAKAQFTRKNQLDRKLEDFPNQPDLLPQPIGPKTIEGLRQNIRVGIAYQQGWNEGNGCIAFENLMEDLATLEISRAQVWQWLHHKVQLDDGSAVTPELVSRVFDEECAHILKNFTIPENTPGAAAYESAKAQARDVFLRKDLADFFTTI